MLLLTSCDVTRADAVQVTQRNACHCGIKDSVLRDKGRHHQSTNMSKCEVKFTCSTTELLYSCSLPLEWSSWLRWLAGSCRAQQGAGHTTHSCLHRPRRLLLLSSASTQSFKSHFSIARNRCDRRGAGWALTVTSKLLDWQMIAQHTIKSQNLIPSQNSYLIRVGQTQRFLPSALFLSCFRNKTFSHSIGNSFLES